MAEVMFVDGMAHYTTTAQANTKVSAGGVAPTAGAGAFGQPGVRSDGWQVNYAATAEVEFSFFFNYSAVFGQWVIIFDNNYPQIWLDMNNDGSVSVYNGGQDTFGRAVRNTLLGTVPAATVQFGVQNHCKLKIKHHATTGTVEFVYNGISALALTNKNTAPSGNAWSTNWRSFGGGSSNVASGFISHWAVANALGTITGQPRLGALFPNGAGAHADFTPSPVVANYLNADESTPDDDTTYNESTVSGNIDTYAMQDLATGVIGIIAVAVTVRIKKTDANSHLVAAVLRIGGVDYVHPTNKGVPGDYAFLQWIWTLSPATGVAFTAAEVNGLEAGLKIIT